MADRALTEDAVLAGLHDIRLPVAAPGGMLADLLAAIGLGLLLAFVLGLLLRSVTGSRQSAPQALSLPQRIAGLTDLPDEERRLALLYLLKENRPDAFRGISAGLYRRNGLPGSDALEAEICQHD